MHSLQPCQLGNDSLLNMVLYPLLDMRGGASLCKPLEVPGGFGVAPVIGVSGVATTGRIWAESQKTPLVIGGIRAKQFLSEVLTTSANKPELSETVMVVRRNGAPVSSHSAGCPLHGAPFMGRPGRHLQAQYLWPPDSSDGAYFPTGQTFCHLRQFKLCIWCYRSVTL